MKFHHTFELFYAGAMEEHVLGYRASFNTLEQENIKHFRFINLFRQWTSSYQNAFLL